MKKSKEKGITLIALVVTIVVLLILAGISIAMLTGENGVIVQANRSSVKNDNGTVLETVMLKVAEYKSRINEEKVTNRLEQLKSDGIIDEQGVVDCKELIGTKLKTGNGSDNKDVYVIEENKLYYYDKDGNKDYLGDIGKDENIEYNSDMKSLKEGDFVYFESQELGVIEGIVLNDTTREYGLEILCKGGFNISKNSGEDVISFYNNVIKKGVDYIKTFVDTSYAFSTRPLGTNPANPYIESTEMITVHGDEDIQLKGEDDNYIYDATAINRLGTLISDSNYYYLSRCRITWKYSGDNLSFLLRPVSEPSLEYDSGINYEPDWIINENWLTFCKYNDKYELTSFVRGGSVNTYAVMKLKNNLIISDGTGTPDDPYIIENGGTN